MPAIAARIGLWLARQKGRPLRLGNRVIAARHEDVTELLARDLDFLIAPVNESRINAVNGGRFVLGMDRSPALTQERMALYSALSKVDFGALGDAIKADAKARAASAGAFDAIADYARPIAAANASRLFGIAPDDKPLFAEVARAIFAHTFLNLGDDKVIEARALAAAPLMQGWFHAEIAKRRAAGGDPGRDFMGQLIRRGQLDDDGIARTLGGMLVGSIDTTTSAFAKILCVTLADKPLAERMTRDWRAGRDIYGLCLDALRRWPHNPIVMRRAACDTMLGETPVKAGDSMIAWTQAAMLDPEAFPDPDRMLPDRPRASYFHFGGGLHACAGRAVNAVQIPILVGALLDAGVHRTGGLGWAGPFPDRLPVRIDGAPA